MKIFQVKYAPVVSVKIISGAASNGRIPEGTEVRFSEFTIFINFIRYCNIKIS